MPPARVLCYIVAYNAAPFIEKVLDGIPERCRNEERYQFDVLISDDCSADNTVAVCEEYIARSPHAIRVQRTGRNLGYGGNQKRGYDYAAREGYDAVVLLHGDGQYDPAYIPALLEPLLTGQAEAVLGSRMVRWRDALAGGMPFYKLCGNILLTRFQNLLAGSHLSEFHTGLRAYSTRALAGVPYGVNSDGYVFDTEILLQLIHAGRPIAEIPIATHYGEETCHVNGPKYAWRVVKATVASRMHALGFGYSRQYDFGDNRYPAKTAFDSSHRFAIEEASSAATVFDIGGGSGHVASALKGQGKTVVGFDVNAPDANTQVWYSRYIQADLDHDIDFTAYGVCPDTVLLLDILEHLRVPGKLLASLRDVLPADSRVIITVPNVAFLPVRLKLLFGSFSYSNRGIMDHTHLRFFTFRSLKRLLEEEGYALVKVRGIPAPFPLVIPSSTLSGMLLAFNRLLIGMSKGLFAFQIAVIARPKQVTHDS